MGAIGNPVLRFVVHAHAVLAIGAAAQVRWIGDEWFGAEDWREPAAAFIGTFACYSLLRLSRSDEEALRHVPVFAWYRANRQAMAIAAAAGALLALVALGGAAWTAVSRLWPVILPALLYVLPFRGADGGSLGLRRIPALKSFLVAWVWAAGTVLLAADALGAMAWLLIAVFFCFYLAIAIAFDARDSTVDPPGLCTLPQLLGPKLAKALALLLLMPLAGMLIVQHALREAGECDAAQLLPLLGLGMAAVLIARASPQRGWLHWLLLDACIALLPLLAWLGDPR